MQAKSFDTAKKFFDDRNFPRGFTRSGDFTRSQASILETLGMALKDLHEGHRAHEGNSFAAVRVRQETNRVNAPSRRRKIGRLQRFNEFRGSGLQDRHDRGAVLKRLPCEDSLSLQAPPEQSFENHGGIRRVDETDDQLVAILNHKLCAARTGKYSTQDALHLNEPRPQ